MIPIPPQVFVFAIKYGQKILIGLLVLSIIIGAYFYWKHTVFKAGAEEKQREWAEYNLLREREAQQIIEAANRENARLRNEDRKRYIGAINSYVEYNKTLESKLASSPKRVFVPIKSDSKTCRETLPGKANIPEAPDRRGREIEWAELGEEATRTLRTTSAEVERMAWLLADAQRQISICSKVE